MASTTLFRLATRSPATSFFKAAPYAARARVSAAVPTPVLRASAFGTTPMRFSGAHEEETFEQFSARYEKEFDSVQDVFELQRNLNNAFAYDLVPSVAVMTAALKAARRVNDFPTAVRVFEGIRSKVENRSQYEVYLEELKDLREELGIVLQEDLYPEESK